MPVLLDGDADEATGPSSRYRPSSGRFPPPPSDSCGTMLPPMGHTDATPKTRLLRVRVEEELADKVAELAARNHRTLSGEVRVALEVHLEEDANVQTPPSRQA